jgi:transposase-like protein
MNTPTKKEISEWLDYINSAIAPKNSRQWLADRIGVSKSTVDNWLSNKKIPPSSAKFIGEVMQQEKFQEPKFTMREAQIIEKAMRRTDYSSFAEFARDIIIERAQKIEKQPCPCAAETPPSYPAKKSPKPKN